MVFVNILSEESYNINHQLYICDLDNNLKYYYDNIISYYHTHEIYMISFESRENIIMLCIKNHHIT